MTPGERRRATGLAVVIVAVLAAGLAASVLRASPSVIVGAPPADQRVAAPGPTLVPPPADAGAPPPAGEAVGASDDLAAPLGPRPEPASVAGLAAPDGQPWRPAIRFTSAHDVPDHLVFVLVAGSDARPGEDLRRARADSVHLLAVNPRSREGTILGFPRDSWVEIPGHGRGRINSALTLGGPDLLAETVRRVSGLPVDYYVLTGFEGVVRMV
ncbi:MAG: LCP family protein, partial [Acidimicrobiia bacterium]